MPGPALWLRSSSRIFKPSGWISWPSPLAFPVSLRVCEGVLESLPGAAVQQQQQQQEAGLGGHWMRESGVVCLLAVQKRQQWTCPKATRVWSGYLLMFGPLGWDRHFFKRLET